MDGRGADTDAVGILYDVERGTAPFGHNDLAGVPVHFPVCVPDRAAVPFRQLDHRHGHVHQPGDDQPGRGGRAAEQHLPLRDPGLRDVPAAAVVRRARNRAQTADIAHHAHERRADRGGAHGAGHAGAVAGLPRERRPARAAGRDLSAQRALQRTPERHGIPQGLQFRGDLGGFHLRCVAHGPGAGARDIRLRHRRSLACDELAVVRLRPRDESPPFAGR